eukprot:COSAG01_NODE_802_length_13465_cov_24.092242_13_plen_341_part_00
MATAMVRTASGRLVSPQDAPQIARLARTRSQNERLKGELQLQLPAGWEVTMTPEGRPYYVDHSTQTTHWDPPVVVPSAPPPYAPGAADAGSAGAGASVAAAAGAAAVAFSPGFIPEDAPGDVAAAVEHAECCICCDPLCESGCSVLTHRGRRVCGHFFHSEPCAASLLRGHHGGMTCPICRKTYDGVLAIPDIEADPQGWFRVVDMDGDGKLSQDEVREVLKALLPVDWRRLEEALPALWTEWDRDGSGTIEQDELFGTTRVAANTAPFPCSPDTACSQLRRPPAAGLIQYVKQQLPRQADAPAPDIRQDRAAWFAYFDEDLSGALDKGELTRALIKTFR